MILVCWMMFIKAYKIVLIKVRSHQNFIKFAQLSIKKYIHLINLFLFIYLTKKQINKIIRMG